jgi:hypothetical protein
MFAQALHHLLRQRQQIADTGIGNRLAGVADAGNHGAHRWVRQGKLQRNLRLTITLRK